MATKKRGAPQKAVERYLAEPATKSVSMDDYMQTPGTAFLIYVCDAFDAFELCKNRFKKKLDGQYNKDSEDSLRHISSAILATVMGHFETYQKGLFAGLFERSRYFSSADIKLVARDLNNPSITLEQISAYRGEKAPVGLSIADALSSWHSPEAVNTRFKSIGLKVQVFSKDDIEMLRTLWQLRHSIVHTGSWLTLPDAQKVKTLRGKGGRGIAFEHTFVNAIARRFHSLVERTNNRLLKAVIAHLGPEPDDDTVNDFQVFLQVKSPKSNWLSQNS